MKKEDLITFKDNIAQQIEIAKNNTVSSYFPPSLFYDSISKITSLNDNDDDDDDNNDNSHVRSSVKKMYADWVAQITKQPSFYPTFVTNAARWGKTGLGADDVYSTVDFPIWLGEIQSGGFHEIIKQIFTAPTSPAFHIVTAAFDKFSVANFGKPLSLEIVDIDGVYCTTVLFGGIKYVATTSHTLNDWTTPCRLTLKIPTSEVSVRKHRIEYGGHFYATGYAELAGAGCGERIKNIFSDDDKIEFGEYDPEMTWPQLESLELNNIFWVDYKRSQRNGVKIL